MTIPGSANPLLLVSAPVVDAGARSLRFNSADSAYLSRTPASAGNRKTWSCSTWLKKCAEDTNAVIMSATGTPSRTVVSLYSGNFYIYSDDGISCSTVGKFRDPSAWYHVLFVLDTTQATAADRTKIYVNSVQQLLTYSQSPGQNTDWGINATGAHRIGGDAVVSEYLNGYLADIHFIDGQALDPTSFGEFDATTGVWVPIEYTGSYGTNGFHLDFADNASTTTIGYDAAGSNDWTANNLSVTAGAGNDSLVDVPTNGAQTDTGAGGEVRGNYCTWNPLTPVVSTRTLTNGNLDALVNGAGAGTGGTMRLNSGKWYWEATINTIGANTLWLGWLDNSYLPDSNSWSYVSTSIMYGSNGNKATDNTAYGSTFTAGDVIGCALDLDTGVATFYKNGVSQGTMGSSLGATNWRPMFTSSTSSTVSANFGQRAFAYTAPSGFKALNTANLPAPTITQPSTVMDVKLYTGNGSTQTISGLGFSPDLVWIKNRAAADNHKLTDIVRGATEELESNTTDAEATNADGLTQFNADGFDLGDDDEYNTSAEAYAAWAWDAGSSTVTNTDGSITSSVRANATAGFSIVTYTGNGSAGATVGHGLGVAPGLIIVKQRSSSTVNKNWVVYHSSLGNTKIMALNLTNAVGTTADGWNNAGPSSTTFTLGAGDDAFASQTNVNSKNYVAYCFAPVAGYSSFGSYVGNGSASDGPFVYTGFRPRFILWKKTNTSTNAPWVIVDTARSSYNLARDYLLPNASDAEAAVDLIDVLSNGYKWRGSAPGGNNSGDTYIYAAFAESCFALNNRAR
jgi:hypothetical protein